ncbi:Holo-[acyl-carrier protein] synthase [Pediococcus damnosus]|uniref:Holo-[acyl-carrier-protein] synthase n=1 Tax=Pediococcus damnosus TaxID=51663 RepID=A0A0R2HKP9_9LACO|nr:holo-ACP synthase [Pediococcus damnosus]AMV60177.1 Holo-[acyl-carrier protein] synthase [Pediococcus damnosus]AMV62697.1 Holo-[acyl-carrier protein] synthase [Pediococcus damnosus]AMV64421.1 Holo-[acyl-carrier protein] synthase [Pediococcus damnosus]AMV67418.1 Holo-[acyl-carrier protein] synthase [Pediococcus damnosus]AMV69716.1 Holo-[acyl-carrier protein] synthase [Pediococcus damnosus]
MIYGTGIDLTDIDRVTEVQARLPKFAERVLTPQELKVYQKYTGTRASEFLAGRFSAKESYSKALGTGIGSGVGFQDVEILDEASGRPKVKRQPFDGIAHVSISHTEHYVMTQMILEKKG